MERNVYIIYLPSIENNNITNSSRNNNSKIGGSDCSSCRQNLKLETTWPPLTKTASYIHDNVMFYIKLMPHKLLEIWNQKYCKRNQINIKLTNKSKEIQPTADH